MKLSKNLSLSEVTKSGTATRRGIDNTPNSNHLENLKVIAKNVFQKIRNHFEEPIFISSGYRSSELNKAIGGSQTSQHSKGQAIDIDQDNKFTSVKNIDVFNYIKDELSFDQLIAEFPKKGNPAWVHVSFVSKSKNRNQVLVAKKVAGITKYIPYNSEDDLK